MWFETPRKTPGAKLSISAASEENKFFFLSLLLIQGAVVIIVNSTGCSKRSFFSPCRYENIIISPFDFVGYEFTRFTKENLVVGI